MYELYKNNETVPSYVVDSRQLRVMLGDAEKYFCRGYPVVHNSSHADIIFKTAPSRHHWRDRGRIRFGTIPQKQVMVVPFEYDKHVALYANGRWAVVPPCWRDFTVTPYVPLTNSSFSRCISARRNDHDYVPFDQWAVRARDAELCILNVTSTFTARLLHAIAAGCLCVLHDDSIFPLSHMPLAHLPWSSACARASEPPDAWSEAVDMASKLQRMLFSEISVHRFYESVRDMLHAGHCAVQTGKLWANIPLRNELR